MPQLPSSSSSTMHFSSCIFSLVSLRLLYQNFSLYLFLNRFCSFSSTSSNSLATILLLGQFLLFAYLPFTTSFDCSITIGLHLMHKLLFYIYSRFCYLFLLLPITRHIPILLFSLRLVHLLQLLLPQVLPLLLVVPAMLTAAIIHLQQNNHSVQFPICCQTKTIFLFDKQLIKSQSK